MNLTRLLASSATLRGDAVAFAQRLVQTKSYAGAEEAVAALVAEEMKRLGYDDVSTDAAGNVVGIVRGKNPQAKAVLFNAHIDTVAVDESEPWPHPPWGGVIDGGFLYGRGACDTKGPLAGQVCGVAALKHAGVVPASDIYVAAVVQEEVGGLGTRALLKAHKERFGACVIGEPSSGMLALGHRGRVEVELVFRGKAAHAAQPSLGRNALYPTAEFLRRVPKIKMPKEKPLGTTTVSPTKLTTAPPSVNVIPSEARLTLDWRNVPSHTDAAILAQTRALAESVLSEGFSVDAKVPMRSLRTYTGLAETSAAMRRPFLTAKDSAVVKVALRALRKSAGAHVKTSWWRFATDGGDAHEAGMSVVGYGEGDESLAHTSAERVNVEDLGRGVAGNAALAMALAELE